VKISPIRSSPGPVAGLLQISHRRPSILPAASRARPISSLRLLTGLLALAGLLAPFEALSVQAQQQAPPMSAATGPVDPGRSFRYRLGPGDRLRMSVFKVEGYLADVEVLSDGTINLPRLNSVPVWGLSLDEAQRRITRLYARYLRRPLVYLDLIAPRPVRITVVGEVQKPGFYSLTQEGQSSNLQSVGAPATTVTSAGWPTLVDALQKAGGITSMANLTDVVLVRQGGPPGSAVVTFQFDFLASLLGLSQTVNPLLMDGDSIQVAKLDGVIPNEILIKAGRSNLSADTIAVTVVGEVNAPGLKQVRSNSSLTEAVMAAGDLNQVRADANFIRLLRMQSDGTVASTRLRFDPAASLGTPNNPSLQNGDVIVVARNGWTSLNQRLSQAVEPLGPLLNAASLYNILVKGP
jgi:polysaccharide export outer membrane protein